MGTIALVMCATFCVTTIFGTGRAVAAAGVWGSGAWPYSNGVICSLVNTTIPLVAWQLNSVAEPAFLTAGIAETAGVDSGRPPTGISNGPPDAALSAGDAG